MSSLEIAVAAGVGILFVALAIPMITRRLRPNWWYGVRTLRTLRDERVWYAVNARSGWGLLVYGSVLALSAPFAASAPVWGGLALIGGMVWGGWSLLLARSAGRERENGHGR